MFTHGPDQTLRSAKLGGIPRLEHGFGTRLSAAPADQAWVRQIHSDLVILANVPGCLGEGDALVSSTSGLTLSVRTADCVPVLMADPGSGVVAAVHAGWRGVVSGIVPKAAAEMVRLGARSERIVAVIGPAIGPCCFEVGPEVAVQFKALLPERDDLSGRVHLDLQSILRRELQNAEVPAENISAIPICTRCREDLLHSFRRDREQAGRQHSWIQWKG